MKRISKHYQYVICYSFISLISISFFVECAIALCTLKRQKVDFVDFIVDFPLSLALSQVFHIEFRIDFHRKFQLNDIKASLSWCSQLKYSTSYVIDSLRYLIQYEMIITTNVTKAFTKVCQYQKKDMNWLDAAITYCLLHNSHIHTIHRHT